jgi:hypothetical protein
MSHYVIQRIHGEVPLIAGADRDRKRVHPVILNPMNYPKNLPDGAVDSARGAF